MNGLYLRLDTQPVPPVPADETPVTSIEVCGQRPDSFVVGVGAALVALIGAGLWIVGEGLLEGEAGACVLGAIFAAVPAGMLAYVWSRHRHARTRWTLTEEGIEIEEGGLPGRVSRWSIPWGAAHQFGIRPAPPAPPERFTVLVRGLMPTLRRGKDTDPRAFTVFVAELSRRIEESRAATGATAAEPPADRGLTPVRLAFQGSAIAILALRFAGVLPSGGSNVLMEVAVVSALGLGPVLTAWHRRRRGLGASQDEPLTLPPCTESRNG